MTDEAMSPLRRHMIEDMTESWTAPSRAGRRATTLAHIAPQSFPIN